jgi:hypothetical protein
MSSFALAGTKALEEDKENSENVKSGVSERADSQQSLDENDLIAKLPKNLKEFTNRHL